MEHKTEEASNCKRQKIFLLDNKIRLVSISYYEVKTEPQIQLLPMSNELGALQVTTSWIDILYSSWNSTVVYPHTAQIYLEVEEVEVIDRKHN